MTVIQLPVLVTDIFTAFGMTDPADMLIVLLSLILGVLLVLIVFIALGGRPSGGNSSHPKGEVSGASSVAMPSVDPVASVATEPERSDAFTAKSANKVENSETVTEQVEDFQIFKRPIQKSIKADRKVPSLGENEQMSTTDHLRLIEKEMVRLRDLYHGGHITRDMYIDETRSLYHQARGLSSLS